MPKIGMRYPIIAKNTAGVYSDAFKCGKAVQGSATPTTYNVKFYADDALAENATGVSDWQLSLEVSDLPITALTVLFGHQVSDGVVGYDIDDQANYVGVGFYVAKMKDNVTSYDAYWYYKVKFTEPTDSFTTQGETVSFSGDSIQGTASVNDSRKFREMKNFATTAAAESWLNTKANYVISG